MRQKDINLIMMCEEAIEELDNYKNAWQDYSVITKQIQKIKMLNSLIQSNFSKQINSGIEAYSRQKNLILSEMIEKVNKIALKAKGYAKLNNNTELLNAVNIPAEKILEENDENIVMICENILNHAASIQDHLIEDFNLSEELILNASANLIQVKQMISIKDDLYKTDVLLSENMKEMITELKTAIDVLDDLIYGIIEDETIINTYKKIRRKVDLV